MERIDEILFFMNQHFGDDRRFSFQFHAIGNWNSYNKKKENDTKIEKMRSATSLYQKLVSSDTILNYEAYYYWLAHPMCYASKKNHFVIGADGKIYKCTVAFAHPENQVGMLCEKGVIEWNELLQAHWITNREKENVEKCKNCFLCGSCHGKGCALAGWIDKNNPGCGCEVDCVEYILQMLYLSREKHNLLQKMEACDD